MMQETFALIRLKPTKEILSKNDFWFYWRKLFSRLHLESIKAIFIFLSDEKSNFLIVISWFFWDKASKALLGASTCNVTSGDQLRFSCRVLRLTHISADFAEFFWFEQNELQPEKPILIRTVFFLVDYFRRIFICLRIFSENSFVWDRSMTRRIIRKNLSFQKISTVFTKLNLDLTLFKYVWFATEFRTSLKRADQSK